MTKLTGKERNTESYSNMPYQVTDPQGSVFRTNSVISGVFIDSVGDIQRLDVMNVSVLLWDELLGELVTCPIMAVSKIKDNYRRATKLVKLADGTELRGHGDVLIMKESLAVIVGSIMKICTGKPCINFKLRGLSYTCLITDI